jgi:hypothetical protein
VGKFIDVALPASALLRIALRAGEHVHVSREWPTQLEHQGYLTFVGH